MTADFAPLPPDAAALLENAPPRLVAHLRAVHDVAVQLADWMAEQYPGAEFDRQAMLFGAATHDIGKTTHIGELSGPGSAHEQAGYELLLAQGVPEDFVGTGAIRALDASAGTAGRLRHARDRRP